MNGRLDREGISVIQYICEHKGWFFREQPISDIGVDALIELVDDKTKSSKLIALQIKSGESYFSEKNGTNYIFRFKEKHYKYWSSYTIPILIVLVKPDEGIALCAELNERNVKSTGKGYKIYISEFSTLEDFLVHEAPLLDKLPNYLYNYNYMLTQLPFLNAIEKGYSVILESEEWANKSSGRGKTSVTITDGVHNEVFHWYYWFPRTPYDVVFKKLFPWADFEPDDDFYYDNDLTFYRDKHCVYDSEIKDNIQISEVSFSEFRNSLSKIRGVDCSGELVTYKLHLQLNDFAKAFLLAKEKLNEISVYRGIKISKEDE